jgi:TPR repeat protein/DNA-binding response OmpR family regulator
VNSRRSIAIRAKYECDQMDWANAMNNADKFALVPRPPGALEKAEPGAKRILSGMIADVLALAKPTQPTKPARSVLLLKDDTFDEMWEMVLKSKFGQINNLRFTRFESASELLSLAHKENFDLIIMYFGNVRWDVPDRDPFDLLASLEYGQRIIVTQGLDLSEQCARIGASFLESPFKLEEAQAAIQLALEAPHHLAQGLSEHPPDFSKTRPLRIVIVNDEQGPLRSMEVVLRGFKGATLSLFQDAREAWEELLRADPALLITGATMPGLTGKEIARRLLDRQATFPIIVTSAYEPEEQWVREYARLGLNVTFLHLPFDISDFLKGVNVALNIPCDKMETPGHLTPSPHALQSRGTHPPRIVVLDDDSEMVEFTAQVIRQCFKDADVALFQDGTKAWKHLSHADPDLLVMDINRTGMDEIETLRRLAALQKAYPILVASGVLTSDVEQRARTAAGPLRVAFMSKPWQPEEFCHTLSTLLGRKPTSGSLVSPPRTMAQTQNASTPQSHTSPESEAWYLMGKQYYFGEGVTKDAGEAVKWFRKAAERNHVEAQRCLGNCYCFGEGVTKDCEQAVRWYYKAAEKNDSGSEFRLGCCYREGVGVATDYEAAVKWFRRAAEHGSGRQAQYNLGVFYEKGEGVTQNYAQAVSWYLKAAEKDHAQAQHNLGVCYEKGYGVQQDFPEAYKFYKLAANNNMWPFDDRHLIAGILKRISTRMTPVEIAEGERRYLEFKTKWLGTLQG